MSTLTLPDKPSPATTVNPKILVIYGPPKVGKTTILSKLNNCIISDLEKGTDYLEALKIQYDNYDDFERGCNLMKLQNPRKYKYHAVDTVDKVEEWSERIATKDYKDSVVGKNWKGFSVLELPNGGGYMWLRNAFHKVITNICLTAPHIILVGHIRDKSLEKDGKEVSSKDLDLTGKCKSIICSIADAIGYVYRGKDGLRISFNTNELVTCGTRCAHLKGLDTEFTDWSKIYLRKPGE